MTVPSGQRQPLLEAMASHVIHGAQERLSIPTRTVTSPSPTQEEKQLASELIQRGEVCRFCAGLHAGASGPACPRLASGKVNGDGTVVEFTFWSDAEWRPAAAGRVVFVEELDEEDTEDNA